VSNAALNAPLFRGLEYAGPIPRTEVREEFLRADVFVLPTLAEGSAIAHIEALACGVPVVTTPNCGTLIRDGVEGFLVPIRDAESLADRIEKIVTNRQLREEMGARARELALREHTWERYEERLMLALAPAAAGGPSEKESKSGIAPAVAEETNR
jgi:glycosyltransferase involved in cell wall biosynthesis